MAVDSLTINSPNYFEEQNNIYDDIHFLEDEHLSFKVCLDKNSQDTIANLICNNNNNKEELYLFNFDTNGCFFSNYEIKNLGCDIFNLEIEYTLSDKLKKITRTFAKQKESYLINHILEKDYTSISIEDTSYSLRVLNEIQTKDYKKNSEIYDYLKSQRDNTNKCWPTGNCDLSKTVTILKNLKESGYDLDSRMIEDGKIYIENNIITDLKPAASTSILNYEFELQIDNEFNLNEDISCDLDIDYGDEERTYSLDDNSDRTDLIINKLSEENIKFTCDSNLDLINLKIFEEKIDTKSYSNKDNLIYTLPSTYQDSADEITYSLIFKNNFTISGNINCDITLDGNTNSYIFDSSSTTSDLAFKSIISNSIEISCDSNIDNIYLDIYQNLNDEIEYTNKNNFDYTLDSSSADISYEFKYNFTYDFSNNEEIICDLNIDDKTTRTYTFDEASTLEIVGKKARDKISFTCDKTLKTLNFELYDIFSRAQIYSETKDVNSHSYIIPTTFSKYSCVGENNICNFKASVDALSIYGIKLSNAQEIEFYLDSLIQKKNNQYLISTTENYLDTGKYLTYKKNDDLISYLKYSQNNDGSWGDSSTNILSNFWAILGLRNTDGESEYLTDGEKWIYYNEPQNGWGSIEKDTLAYLAIKEKLKPYIDITAINEISDVIKFKLSNPTIYNLKELKITFDPSITKYLKVTENLGKIDALSDITFNISVISGFAGSAVGNIIIEGLDGKNNKLDLLELPVIIKGPTPFKIVDKNYFISTSQSDINIELEKNLDLFSVNCDFTNPLTGLKQNSNLTQNNLNIKLLNPEFKSGEYNVNLNCDFQGSKFNENILLKINKTDETFDTENEVLYLNSNEDFSIKLNSTYNDKQILSFKIEGDLSSVIIPTEDSKIIASMDLRDIYFKISKPELIEVFKDTINSKIIITSDTGFSKSIPIFINLDSSNSSNKNSNWWVYLIIGVVVIILILILVRRYRELQEDEEEFIQNNNEEEMYFD